MARVAGRRLSVNSETDAAPVELRAAIALRLETAGHKSTGPTAALSRNDT